MQTATTRVKETHSLLRLDPAFPFDTMTTKAKENNFSRCRIPGIRHAQTSCLRQAQTLPHAFIYFHITSFIFTFPFIHAFPHSLLHCLI